MNSILHVRPRRLTLRLRTGTRGAVLVVGLIFLALLTLMGATAYTVATQQERMTANSRDQKRAFETAEYALRTCEADAATVANWDWSTPGYGPSPAAGMAALGDDPSAAWAGTAPQFRTVALNGQTVNGTANANQNELAQDPRCVLEAFEVEMPSLSLKGGVAPTMLPLARVTATAWGTQVSTRATVQSIFMR
jgi:type IV pilus assembly protein PilX